MFCDVLDPLNTFEEYWGRLIEQIYPFYEDTDAMKSFLDTFEEHANKYSLNNSFTGETPPPESWIIDDSKVGSEASANVNVGCPNPTILET